MRRSPRALLVATLLVVRATSAQQASTPAPEAVAASDGAAPINPPASSDYVPPLRPASDLPEMSHEQMIRAMAMDDAGAVGKLLVDQLEWRDGDGQDGLGWDAQGWYGGDYDKFWAKTEGERLGDVTEDARAELLWDRIFARWWSTQVGLRQDFGGGPPRSWIALGLQGIAPYFFDVEATAYVGDSGRTAARFRVQYELLFTQRLILQSQFETNLYGKDDPARNIGAGFSDLQLGLRLRYEIRRELAPYVGINWLRDLGKTADMVRAAGEDPSDLQLVVGVRFWF